MRIGTSFIAASFACWALSALAQQQSPPRMQPPQSSTYSRPATPVEPTDPALIVGSSLFRGNKTGLDEVAEDGISIKTVKAVPCATAARETDGTTTCIGIPDAKLKKKWP
jgi:hypothetical protein